MKLFSRHLHQILENWAGRKFITALRENSLLLMHAGAEMYSYQRIQLSHNKFINGILRVMLDLGTVISSNICRCLNFLYQLICFCLVCIKGILKANKPGNCARNQISVHNVVHPYRFTRDMLAGMRVLQQLDDKFIVGVLSQEGRIH